MLYKKIGLSGLEVTGSSRYSRIAGSNPVEVGGFLGVKFLFGVLRS